MWLSLRMPMLLSIAMLATIGQAWGADAEAVSKLIQSKCFDCHSGEAAEGNFELGVLANSENDPEQIVLENRKRWSHVFARVKFNEMPPRDAEQLSDEEKATLLSWIEGTLKKPNEKIDPGPHVIRRLSRSEYSATLRDILGVHVDLGQGLPIDAAGGEGFDNAVETLFLSEMHLEKYIQAADDAIAYVSTDKSARETLFGEDLSKNDPNVEPPILAAERVVRRFLSRAFRRPCNQDEVDRYMNLVAIYLQQEANYEAAVLSAVRAALVSPNFLFRVESPAVGPEPERINDYELATRLSYMLWGSMPDEELFSLAASGKLHEPDVLRSQVDRMSNVSFGSERSGILKVRTFAETFVGQWLGTRDLGVRVKPDTKVFPDYNYEIEFAFQREPAEFFEYMVSENRPILDLLDSDYSFLTRESAHYCGLKGVKVKGWGQVNRIELPENSHRGGILGMGGVLAVSSHAHRTSPVLRGKWVLETFFDSTLPPPPPDIPNLDAQSESHPEGQGATMRERLTKHREDAACASCHDRIDPIGFALENYDATGRWREEENGKPIDASAQMPDGTQLNGPDGLKKILMDRKDEFARVLTSKMLGYSLGRGLVNTDQYWVEKIVDRLKENEYHVREIVYGIVESDPFLYKAGAKQ
jgi:hypothetical protein